MVSVVSLPELIIGEVDLVVVEVVLIIGEVDLVVVEVVLIIGEVDLVVVSGASTTTTSCSPVSCVSCLFAGVP